MTIKVTIEGEFTAFELALLITCIRGIDCDERYWKVFIDDPGSTLKEAEVLLRHSMPEVPGRTTIFTSHRKQ